MAKIVVRLPEPKKNIVKIIKDKLTEHCLNYRTIKFLYLTQKKTERYGWD